MAGRDNRRSETARAGVLPLRKVCFALPCFSALGLVLAGCASGGGEALTSVYIDPARYALYDCVQLRATMRSQTQRASELQGLINKAQSGFAGGVISEVAYRNDYISARANYKLAEDEWRRNGCEKQRLPTDTGAPKPLPRSFEPPVENEQLRQNDQIYRRPPPQ